MKIAVIGAGVAGLVAAHRLSAQHEVTVFERNTYLGGHTNTVVIGEGPDAGTAVDTGFIVYNHRTYPNFVELLTELGVDGRDSDMSYGYHDTESGLQWGGHDLGTLFAQRSNLVNPSFLRMVIDMARFNQGGQAALANGSAAGLSLSAYCRRQGFSPYFERHYLQSLGAALWSTHPEEIADFPAEAYLRFFSNHGLLSITDRPRWLTVKGGSHAYVKAIRARFKGHVHLSTPVEGVRRDASGVDVRAGGSTHRFDAVVLAGHADQTLALLDDPSDEERALLSPWRYAKNETVLHTDTSILPPNRRVWSSWNSVRRPEGADEGVFVTYDMNRLQGLETRGHYLVTLNGTRALRDDRVIASFTYHHPGYTVASLATQARLPSLNGRRSTWFCGSYFGNGFHEDAVRSAVDAVASIAAHETVRA